MHKAVRQRRLRDSPHCGLLASVYMYIHAAGWRDMRQRSAALPPTTAPSQSAPVLLPAVVAKLHQAAPVQDKRLVCSRKNVLGHGR